ncbi:MAG: metallophosphoesterase [Deltaproteobacteria bacterium]|nr:metallophosphoesterase [Deltaproteobacteria bacterium]
MTTANDSESKGRALTWLHVSDFHFEPDSSFERIKVLDALLDRIREYRRQGSWVPDLIFVTGDVANRGADREYDRATEFFDRLLDAAGLDKSRLFVVPGNHDVDRTQGWLLERTLGSEETSDAFFSDATKAQARHLAKLRAFREWHSRYFKGVRESEPFSACAPPEVVTARRVRLGVLSLNSATFSADDSDYGKLWIGRRWLDDALTRLDALDAELRVALVHHPLDWLHDAERGQIKAQLYKKIHVLLRGHLHDTEAEATAVPARGVLHLAAGAAYQAPRWPRRALYATAWMDSGEVRIHPIRYEPSPHRAWTLDTSVFAEHAPTYEAVLALRGAQVREDAEGRLSHVAALHPRPRSRAATHERVFRVSTGNGITDVTVHMTGVEVNEDLILAMPTPPFCDVRGDETAEVTPDDEGPSAVHREELPDGRHRFSLLGTRRYERLSWGYSFSNGVALTQTDRRLMGDREPWMPKLPDDTEGRSHVVRVECDHFRMVVDFQGASLISSASVRVERWKDHLGHETWVQDRAEAQRCHVVAEEHRATLAVDRPLLGHRYTLAFQLTDPGWRFSSDVLCGVDEIREACRAAASPQSGLPLLLTEATEAALQPILGGSLGPRAAWIGFLWDEKRQLLFTSFGRFPNQAWGVRFPHGGGVAGHAFRFGRTATWFRGDDPRRSLIYQPRADGGLYAYEYAWVVCVPILCAPEGPAVGIVSFGAPDVVTNADRRLMRLAQDSAREPTSEHVRKFDSQLVSAINATCWEILARAEPASASLRDLARSTVLRLAGEP